MFEFWWKHHSITKILIVPQPSKVEIKLTEQNFICQIFNKLRTKQPQQHTDKEIQGQETSNKPLWLTSLVSPVYNDLCYILKCFRNLIIDKHIKLNKRSIIAIVTSTLFFRKKKFLEF